MYYKPEGIDEGLKCSICHQQFVEVVKMLPECGESICGECYDALKSEVNESGEFQCQVCQESHLMPKRGLANNKGLLRMLKSTKLEKPLSEQAKTLKSSLKSIESQIEAIRAFDGADHVNNHCDQLEIQVQEAIESAVECLSRLEEDLLKQIKEYRQRCLDSMPAVSNSPNSSQINPDLEALSKEVGSFSSKWNDYFSRVEALASDVEIDAALSEAKELEKKMLSSEERLKKDAFDGTEIAFEDQQADIFSIDYLKTIFKLSIRKTVKSFRFYEKPTLTLTGHAGDVNQVIFLPCETLASCSDDKTIRVWSLKDQSLLYQLQAHEKQVNCVCLLSNGWLASGSGDSSIKIWDLNQKSVIRTLLGHTHRILKLYALKNGRLASYSRDDTIKIWDLSLNENNLLLDIKGHGNTFWISTLCGILANENIVTCSRGESAEEESILRVWSSNDGKLIKSFPTGMKEVSAFFVLADDRVIIGANNGTIKIVDWMDPTKSQTIENAHRCLNDSFSQLSNGNIISCGYLGNLNDNYAFKVWSHSDLNLLQTVTIGHSAIVDCLSISADEKLLATASRDRTIKIWSIFKQ